MTETERDLRVLVEIAKLDARIAECRTELGLLPQRIAKAKKTQDEIAIAEASAAERLTNAQSERRTLEQKLQDNAEQVKKYKTQLMEVKTNKEYTAMLHEISHLEKDIDAKEERLLLLMDELDDLGSNNKASMEKSSARRDELKAERKQLEERARDLTTKVEKLEAQKPQMLSELDPKVRRRYERVLAKMTNCAVTNITGETCQGCFTRIPPQTSVEVRKNDRIITCEACGRILVHYDA